MTPKEKVEAEKRYKEEIARAEEADKILNSSLFKQNFDIIRAMVITDLSSCDPTDSKKLMTLTNRLQVVNQFEGTFKRMIERGEVAESRLAKLVKLIKR